LIKGDLAHDISFLFPAVLFLRLQVWRRRKNLAGGSPPPDSDLLQIFEKIAARCQSNSPSGSNRRFELHKRTQLFIRSHNEPLSVVAMCVCNKDRPPVGIDG
jgi:hypothetical protein